MRSSGRYESSDGGNLGTAITFLLIGMGAGALAALLMAPKSGRDLDGSRIRSCPPSGKGAKTVLFHVATKQNPVVHSSGNV